MLDYIAVWFVFLSLASGAEPTGYIPPQDVRKADMSCGLPGAVVGVQIDRLVNPSFIEFPDPGFANMHCRASIAARVAGLQPGIYEIATTEMGRIPEPGEVPGYIGIDPHVSVQFTVTTSTGPFTPVAPAAMRVSPQP